MRVQQRRCQCQHKYDSGLYSVSWWPLYGWCPAHRWPSLSAVLGHASEPSGSKAWTLAAAKHGQILHTHNFKAGETPTSKRILHAVPCRCYDDFAMTEAHPSAKPLKRTAWQLTPHTCPDIHACMYRATKKTLRVFKHSNAPISTFSKKGMCRWPCEAAATAALSVPDACGSAGNSGGGPLCCCSLRATSTADKGCSSESSVSSSPSLL